MGPNHRDPLQPPVIVELGMATKEDIQKVREAIQVLTAMFGKIIIKLDKALESHTT